MTVARRINMNEIKAVEADSKAVAADYLRSMGMKLPQRYEAQFIELCKAYQLNPFKRECYAVGYGERWNIITGYEVYIKRAERTGKLDGWDCAVEGSGDGMVAKLTIYRKDWQHPFHHFVLYKEAVQRTKDGSVNQMWAKMGSFMLRKVCIAQGFRLCFPDELGGMPYTSDELPEINVTPQAEHIDNCQSAGTEQAAQRPQEDPKAGQPGDAAMMLKGILSEYSEFITGKPLELANGALASGDEAKISAMVDRCVNYLKNCKAWKGSD